MKYVALFALLTTVYAGDLTPVDFTREQFYELEHALWPNVTDPQWSTSGLGLGGDVELTKAFALFDDKVKELQRPPRPPVRSWLWTRAMEKLQVIEGQYKSFIEFVKEQAAPGSVAAPVKRWLDIAEMVLTDPTKSVAQEVKKLDELLEHGDMFRSALQEDHPDFCELQLSPQQLIYDMYNTISLTEIKGYAMMQFSWMLLRIYGKGNYTQEASLTRQRYEVRTAKTAAAARSAMAMARTDLYRCDPVEHVQGETFDEVTRLLQGYIENEVDMNPDKTCKENCAAYTLTKNYGCYDDHCEKQPTCNGRILECKYIDSDMWICPANPHNSNRRYEWIEYENGRILGKQGGCARGTTKVDSWWRWNLLHCSYCMCLCEDASRTSERFFSLKEAKSDIKQNKVVTGIRMVKLGRVFHLQVSEGLLGERGMISPGGWVPVQRFDPAEPGVNNGVDYHELTYEKRAVDLDELNSPEGSIMTGARFTLIGAHLHFEIRSTPFNYTTGRLFHEKSQWISNDNTEGADTPRKLLTLFRPDLPTRSLTPLPVDSKHDQYLEFTHSDFEYDAAQSTVPFVDIQPLQPMKGTAMISGAGVIHRGVKGSGGFLALKLFTYNYTRHVKAEAPPDSLEDFTEEPAFNPVVN